MAASAAIGGETVVPAGSDLSALINSGQTDLFLAGDAVWNTTLTGTLARDFVIDGNGKIINVRANTSMIVNLLRSANMTINDATVTSSGTTLGTYLIGFGTGNYTSTLNVEGTTFDGYYSTLATGGGIIYAYGDNHKITIDGGVKGVTFSNNRGQSESAGAVSLYFSDLTFDGKVVFDSNWTGNYGGAVAVYDADNRLTFNGETTFSNNHSVVFGGALDLWGGNNTEVTFNGATVFDGNYVRYQTAVDGQSPPHVVDQNPRGGAINIGYVGIGKTSITFNDEVAFTGNRVISTDSTKTAMGGAISVFGNGLARNYQVIFNDAAIFDGNYAVSASGRGDGGAIFYDSSAALLSLTSGSEFLNNSASRYGGAIYLQSGTIQLNAVDDDIIFQGNRQGVAIDANYAPTTGSGKPNAIYLGTGGNLDFLASSGQTIHMHDPIASVAGSSVIITKSGGGEVIFYGDNGATSDYHSLLQASTTVSGGSFTLTDGVHYGGSDGTVKIQTGGTFRGGNDARLLAGTVTVAAGGGLGAVGGLFTVESADITFQDGAFIRGNGTLAATSGFKLNGQIAGEVTGTDQLEVTAILSGTGGLSKIGSGTLVLNAANTYTGATDIQAGALVAGADNVFAQSGQVTVNSGATLDLAGHDQIAQRLGDGDDGGGTVNLGSAVLTAQNGTGGDSSFSGQITGSGSLVKTGDGNLTLRGESDYTGGTTITGGRLIMTNAAALGTGSVVNNGELELALTADGTVINQVTGSGAVYKTGGMTATLTADSTMGQMTVSEGRLALAGDAHLIVDDAYIQTNQGTLAVHLGQDTQPVITAGRAELAGTLEISGINLASAGKASDLEDNRRIVIQTTTSPIAGDFDQVDFNSSAYLPGYLIAGGQFSEDKHSYSVGVGLAWKASPDQAHGTFDLTRSGDVFEVDVALNDRDDLSSGNPWDGRTLTKTGLGTLILSRENTYTGATDIQAGTLTAGIANAFAQSEAITLADGAVLNLNGYDQTAQRLSDGDGGGGIVDLGSATLTAQNDTGGDSTFSGKITGSGSLVKTGNGNLTLSGESGYTGGTTIDAGRLIITNGQALGTGGVANNGELELALTADGEVANQLTGSGAVYKTGNATVTLSAAGSEMGSLDLEAGGLILTGDPGLTISGAYTQSAGTDLIVTYGGGEPVITAGSASLAGNLRVNGFTSQAAPTSASALNDQRYTVIESTDDITSDFDSVIFDPTVDTSDYLVIDGRVSGDLKKYAVGLGLSWYAAPDAAHGTFTLTEVGDSFNVDVVLIDRGETIPGWDGQSLTKKGEGELILSAANTYTGTTDIQAGTLTAGAVDAFATSTQVKVNSGATLNLDSNLGSHNQTAQRLSNGDDGGGTVNLGSATLTAQNDTGGDSAFSGKITGSGSLVKTGNGNLTLSGENDYGGGTTISAGRLIIENARAMGTGAVSNGSELELALTADGEVTNQLTGDGSLIKTGGYTAILTGQNSSVANVDVQAGALHLNQDGAFEADTYTTQGDATTIIGGDSQLLVTGQFTQDDDSSLSVYVGGPGPAVTSENTRLGGNLSVMGLNTEGTASASALTDQHFIVVESTNEIIGDFGSFQSDSMGNGADYLSVHGWLTDDKLAYMVGLDLAWNDDPDKAHGTFTLAKEGDTFEVDVVLNDRTNITSGWDGQSLTKKGEGTLILSRENTYTGATDIQAGTLTAGIANAFAQSSQVKVNSGATLNLAGFDQTAQRLSDGDEGGGTVALGSATLTAQNDTGGDSTFSGQITGSGSLVKTGNGNLTLSGKSDYTGGTTINGGSLTITNGLALGGGTANVRTDARLVLSLTDDGEVANRLDGEGWLIKTGSTIATLTSADTYAENLKVEVQEGVLSLAQNGGIILGSWTTADGATTELRPGAFLLLGNAFIQDPGSILEVGLSNSQDWPVIAAASVTLDGNLVIDGFTPDVARSSVITADRRVIIESNETINGDFKSVDFGGQTSGLDFLFLNGEIDASGLTYSVGFELAWTSNQTDLAHGTFTLPGSTIFEVDEQLNDRDDVTNPDWNGRDLTKNGEGTLILSKENAYTGATAVNGGLLFLTSDSALGHTSSLTIADQAAVDLDVTSQVVGRLDAKDGSRLFFGGGHLTINENQREQGDAEDSVIAGGSLSGEGSLILNPATVTVMGANAEFGGDVIVESGSELILKNAAGLGTYGLVTLMSEHDVLTFDLDSGDVERFSKILAGQGRLEVIDGSAVALTSDNHGFIGSALVKEGMLIVGEDDSPENILGAQLVEVSADGVLSGQGRIVGQVNNAGIITALNGVTGYEDVAAGNLSLGPLTNSGAIALNGSSVGNTLTVSGGLTSNGGLLILNTVLGDDDSLTDRLILDGGHTSGTTELVIINQGGQGGATRQGILVVSAINGATTDVDAFELSTSSSNYRAGAGTLAIGAYDYSLLRGGMGGEAESWYLVSDYSGESIARPETGVLLVGRETVRNMFSDSLYDRLMSYQPQREGDEEPGCGFGPHAFWSRVEGGRTRSYANNKNLRNDVGSLAFNLGADLFDCYAPNIGRFSAGLMFGLGRAEIDTESRAGQDYKADGTVEGYTVGLYGTWFQHRDRRDGFYVDAWLKRSWFSHRITGRGLPGESFHSRLWSASLEGGYSATIYRGEKSSWSFDPSFQAIYHRVGGGPAELNGARVGGWADNSWTTRLGGRLHGKVDTGPKTALSPYLEINWLHDTGKSRVFLDQDAVASNRPRNTAEFKLGLAADWKNGLSANVGLTVECGSHKYRAVGGQIGIRYEW